VVGKRRFEHCIGVDWNEGSREREDLMAEVKDNIRLGRVGARSVRWDVRSEVWGSQLRNDGGRVGSGSQNNRRFKLRMGRR